MPKGSLSSNRELSHLLEKQLRNWEIAQSQKAEVPEEPESGIHHCLAISRAVGIEAHKIGEMIAHRLGWPLFDKEILQAMAAEDSFRQRLYATMDTRVLGWLEGFARGLTLGLYSKEDYFHRLTETVLSIALKGHAVFVGRGTHLILPQSKGFRVRLIAPEDFCIESYARQKSVSHEEAVSMVERIRKETDRFIQNHFHVDVADESRYDLLINVARFSYEEIVEVIVSTMRMRGILT